MVATTTSGPPDASGRPTSTVVAGTEETIPCDTVIVAVGEKADVTSLPAELDFKISSHGWPEGKQSDWMTDVEGVFATGGKSIVHAMAAGTQVAEAMDAYIRRKRGSDPVPRPDPLGAPTPAKLPDGYGGPTWHR